MVSVSQMLSWYVVRQQQVRCELIFQTLEQQQIDRRKFGSINEPEPKAEASVGRSRDRERDQFNETSIGTINLRIPRFSNQSIQFMGDQGFPNCTFSCRTKEEPRPLILSVLIIVEQRIASPVEVFLLCRMYHVYYIGLFDLALLFNWPQTLLRANTNSLQHCQGVTEHCEKVT